MAQILPITGLPAGELPPAVLVCGDPQRATKIAAHLKGAQLLTEQREYRCYTGSYEGLAVAVCSHGVGAPGAAVAFEELIAAGAQQIIRVGTCGGIQPDVVDGDLVIATAAVQHTGYGRQVAPAGYPAVAHHQVVQALESAVRGVDGRTHTGIVLTSDSFYPGVTTPDTADYHQLSAARVLAVEMECAALFLVGSLRGVRVGAILAVDGNVLAERESIDSYQPHRPVVAAAVEAGILTALQALRALA